MNYSTPDFPVRHYLPELAQTHVHWASDAIQPSHPLVTFLRNRLFTSGGHRIGASASASVLADTKLFQTFKVQVLKQLSLPFGKHKLHPCYLECGPQTSGISYTWEQRRTFQTGRWQAAGATMPAIYMAACLGCQGFPGGLDGKQSSCSMEELGLIPGWERSLEEGMATHSRTLAWRIPWTEEPGRLHWGLRIEHNWVTKYSTAWAPCTKTSRSPRPPRNLKS